jgi:hypothetical protein
VRLRLNNDMRSSGHFLTVGRPIGGQPDRFNFY